MRATRQKRILVVEDDHKTAELVRLYLQRAGYWVDTVYDGTLALEKAQQEGFDLIVLDIMLPGRDGLSVCRQIRQESDIPIIMLTAKVLESDRLQGFDSGADDYVVKPFSPRELVARVQAILRRSSRDELFSGPAEVTHGKLTVDFRAGEVRVAENELHLTPTEFRILAAMVREPGKVFSRGELIEKALGLDYRGFDRTLDVHILNLRRKLKAADPSADRYIKTVYGMGYKFEVIG